MSFGNVEREIGVLPGEFRGASFTIALNNVDQWFSKIKAAEVVRRRPVELWIGDTTEGVDDFELIAVGRVRNWTGRDVIQLQCEDIVTELDHVITTQINSGIFPDAPRGSLGKVVPLVIGESALDGGALPAYAINATTKLRGGGRERRD